MRASSGTVTSSEAFLHLSDGRFTRVDMHREVLKRLPAERVHVIIDSCHSFFLVNQRPVNSRGERVPVDPEEESLSNYAHVGFLLSTSDSNEVQGRRLPTKEEWIAEASAEGSRSYPWGEQTPTCEYAVMDEGGAAGCGLGLTGPVCSKPMGNSVSGLCDMSGSVWEFVSDSTQSRPQLLGGSWLSGLKGGALRADGVAVLSRPGIENNFGFRCAKSLE